MIGFYSIEATHNAQVFSVSFLQCFAEETGSFILQSF